MASAEQEDIVTRLRDMSLGHEQVCEEAASAIVHLRRLIAELQSRVFPADEVPEPDSVPRKRKKALKFPRGTPAKERLMAMVEVDPGSGCWVWLGSGTEKYGIIRDDTGKSVYAHRLSYTLHTGYQFKKGEQALHACDNTWCVNPDHLMPGTNNANVRDKMLKGRHYLAKITFEQAQQIRRRYDDGETGTVLAKEFGVSVATVSSIVVGRAWNYSDEKKRGRPKQAKQPKQRLSSLTPKKVRDIRKRHAAGESQASIAARYGISGSSVSHILRKLRWREVK